eukprot:Tbor_TRINITY_DN5495_c1_g1::TRINITY_DN5495_c1_g1_i1::g.24260::m.24260
MVVICCKRLPREENGKDYDEFLMNFPNTALIGDVTDNVQVMQNSRIRLKWMIAAAKQLAKDSCKEETKHLLLGPSEEGDRYLSLARSMELKLESTQEEVDNLINIIKGGVMVAFPEECSGADALRRNADLMDSETASDADRSKAHRILSVIDDGATTEDTLSGNVVMWWSSKPLARESTLQQYIGKNEKTKIIVKLAKEGSAGPPREPAIDAVTQREMMAYWYKKQEEAKKLVEDDDISFTNSEWANPAGLKQHLHGGGNISYRPK